MTHTPSHIDYLEFSAGSQEGLQANRQFYETVFGWSYQEWGDEYVDTQSSGLANGIALTSEKRAPLPVVDTDDLEASLQNIKVAGGNICRDIFDFPGGRRFYFTDPSGNELAVWSDK